MEKCICGAKNSDEAIFCKDCGNKISNLHFVNEIYFKSTISKIRPIVKCSFVLLILSICAFLTFLFGNFYYQNEANKEEKTYFNKFNELKNMLPEEFHSTYSDAFSCFVLSKKYPNELSKYIGVENAGSLFALSLIFFVDQREANNFEDFYIMSFFLLIPSILFFFIFYFIFNTHWKVFYSERNFDKFKSIIFNYAREQNENQDFLKVRLYRHGDIMIKDKRLKTKSSIYILKNKNCNANIIGKKIYVMSFLRNVLLEDLLFIEKK